MQKKLNIPAAELLVRRDHESRVALEYYRGELWSEYVGFDAHGPQCFRVPTADFLERFDRPLETPVERAALTFLRSLPSAHLPGDGVQHLLLEIFTMTSAQTADLGTKTLAELTAHYNQLGSSNGTPPVKSFKSKPEALKRIAALAEKIGKPTEKQAAAKAERANGVSHAAETLAKRATAKKAEPKEKKGATGKAKHAAAKKAVAKPKKEGGAPRGQGIGAFCIDLINKGKDNEQVLEAVRKKFPDAKTGPASIAWYRNKVKEAA